MNPEALTPGTVSSGGSVGSSLVGFGGPTGSGSVGFGRPVRLDRLLAERGLAPSRTAAARLIAAGMVTVDGRAVIKPAALIGADQQVSLVPQKHYVSRSAHKLLQALTTFAISAQGRLALDVGASTGGFTQVLLEAGASRVIALDVGSGQLHPVIAADPRVITVENFNARELAPDSLRNYFAPDLIVADVSFISLTKVIGPLRQSTLQGRDYLLLVKPQFEVGRQKHGVVKSSALHKQAIQAVVKCAEGNGLDCAEVMPTELLGESGNQEFMLHLTPESTKRKTHK